MSVESGGFRLKFVIIKWSKNLINRLLISRDFRRYSEVWLFGVLMIRVQQDFGYNTLLKIKNCILKGCFNSYAAVKPINQGSTVFMKLL